MSATQPAALRRQTEARRFTRHRRRRWAALLTVLVPIVLVVAFAAVSVLSPLLAVRTIRIEGLNRLTEPAVTEALADLRGRPLPQVTEQEVAARLAPFVLVQSYAVRAELPNTLVVEVVERQAIGAVAEAGALTVYDAAGVALWSEQSAPVDVPLLELAGAALGSPAFSSAAAVSLALPADFRAEVASIAATSADAVTLTLRDGTRVLWGGAEDSARKVQVLLALLQATGDREIQEADVSSPEAPVIR